MKIAVIGGRNRTDHEYIYQKLRTFFMDGDILVSGGADGVDTIAESFARERGYKTTIFHPDYARYRKNAPLERNKLIAKEAEIAIAFPADDSTGTHHALEQFVKNGKRIVVFDAV